MRKCSRFSFENYSNEKKCR